MTPGQQQGNPAGQTTTADRKKPYRILSLDGGGIRGLLTAVILEEIGSRVGSDWIGKADLIAGTSSGGMIALALAKGLTPTDARNLFYDRGPIMFEDSLIDNLRNVGQVLGAEFSTRNRRKVLEDIFGDDRLEDLSKKVLISTVDLHDKDKGRWKAKFFHNFEPGPSAPFQENRDRKTRASDVALYTSAAPTYFPSVGRFVDGGLVVNNPSMAAVAQARDTNYLGGVEKGEKIVLLSVGAGRNRDHIETEDELDWGYLQWGKHLVNLVISAAVDVAHYQCRQILPDRYHRIDYDFPEFQEVGIAEYEKRDQLVEIGEQKMDRDLGTAAEWIEMKWMPDEIFDP